MNHVERLLIVVFSGAALVGAYFLYQSPQVRELLQSPSPRPVAGSSAPVRTESEPDSTPPRTSQPSAPRSASRDNRRKPATPKLSLPPLQDPVQQNQVPNQQVARVLLQILAARGLAGGISLTVADEWLEVIGETESRENRAAILEVLEQGRESRRIVADQLVVKSPR